MKEKLTGKLVSALKTTGKEYEVHDTLVVGLFVRVTAAGFKSYVVRWRRASKSSGASRHPYPRPSSPGSNAVLV